ncbi:MAG: ABC transporter ATP-binding protein [Chitinispirillaceae bacterium]
MKEISFKIGTFALEKVDLGVARGKYSVLTGPNGAGKSILLKLICGLYKPTDGTIAINESQVTALPPWRRNVGYVPQDGTLFPNRSVKGNILFGLEVRKIEKDIRKKKADDIMSLLNITHLQDRKIAGLSGGERQKVSLARALVFDPSVLLLDEPVSAIDESSRDNLCREIKRIQRELNVTTLHVSHNSRETELVADTILYLRNGKIESEG